MKVFFAKDIHNIQQDISKPLVLGGVVIKNSQYSIVSHSDGDIIIHAIVSCLLSSLNEKTIGEIYPDTDDINKNRSSKDFLIETLNKLQNKKIFINNIDITIVCEKIILKDFLLEIQENLINIIKNNNITIKATRFEDDVNKIECHCVVTTTN